MTLEVRPLERDREPQWTEFVSGHDRATLYHTLLWRDFVVRVFGHSPCYLECSQGGRVRGVLPLFLVSAPLLGSKLISLPYDIGSGGPLADGDEAAALARHAMALARELDVSFLELRCSSPRPALEGLGLERSEPVILSEVPLDGRDAVWKRISRDQRESIRKSVRRGVKVRQARSLDDYLAFYRVYLEAFRDFGTPPYAEAYFHALWDLLHPSGAVRLFVAEADGRFLGGLQMFPWHRRVVSKFALCIPESVPLRAYPALYWRAVEWGLENRFLRLSWGTSARAQPGLIRFKERWGAISRPAVFYDLAVRAKKIPEVERYYETTGPARTVWRRLPLPLTAALGGPINRWFC